MGILDIFRTAPAQPAQVPTKQLVPGQPGQPVQTGVVPIPVSAPAPGQPPTPVATPPMQGNIPAASTVPVEPGNPTAPVVTPAVPAEPAKPQSPLAEFSGLWDTKPTDPANPPPAGPTPLTAEAIQKVVGKANFASGITPETMTAIAAGGEEAQKAFAAALNAATQQAVTQAILASNKLTEQAVATAENKFAASLPELLRNQAAADHLKSSNPLFADPAIKPIIEATQAQMLEKNPTATHAQITEMTQNYILAMGEAFAPKKVVNDNVVGTETDWEAFLSAD